MSNHPMRRFFLFLCLLEIMLAVASVAQADSGGLQTSVAVDIVGNAFSREKGSPASKLNVREAELFLYAPIDHLFDGVLGIAAHQEKGAALFEIHEATIGSNKLIPWSRFRVGQYFLGVGKLNSVHRHDWPFTSAPKVHEEFFGKEGVDDTGIEYSVLPPLPVYLDLTIGVTNGWKYGHVHNSGKEPKTPTHYLRLANFVGLPLDGGLQTGLNYLSRKDSESTRTARLFPFSCRENFGIGPRSPKMHLPCLRWDFTCFLESTWFKTWTLACDMTITTL
jgi:hypothetical protein